MKPIVDYQFMQTLQTLPFIEEVWLFGSRARGDNQARSDIDIAIICPDASDKDWLRVLDIIDEADTLLKIDCVRFEKNKLSKALYQNILKDKKVIYVKNSPKT